MFPQASYSGGFSGTAARAARPATTPQRPPAAILPPELWAQTASHLAPRDFVALTATCHDLHRLRAIRPVLASVLLRNPIANRPHQPGFHALHSNVWQEVLAASRLLGALQKSPVQATVLPSSLNLLTAMTLSPNKQHLLAERTDTDNVSSCAVFDLSRRVTRKLRFKAKDHALYAKFSTSGRHLVVGLAAKGPVQLFDLSDYAKPPCTVVENMPYSCGHAFDLEDGLSFVMSCSDRKVRTFRLDQQSNVFSEVSQFLLQHDGELIALSQSGGIYLIEHLDVVHVYHHSVGAQAKWLGDVDAPCCGDIILSPHGKYVSGRSECHWPSYTKAIVAALSPPAAIYDVDHNFAPLDDDGLVANNEADSQEGHLGTVETQPTPPVLSMQLSSDRAWMRSGAHSDAPSSAVIFERRGRSIMLRLKTEQPETLFMAPR